MNKQINSANDALQVVEEISKLLNTGLDRETLAIIVALCEQGVNPEGLAQVIKEMKRESAAIVVQVPDAEKAKPTS